MSPTSISQLLSNMTGYFITSVGNIGLFQRVNGSNSTDPVTVSMGTEETLLFVLLTSILIVATIVGNILVILSVSTYKPLRNVPNYFIVSLAVADLAVAVCVMPYHIANYIIGRWVFGKVFCNLWLTCDLLTCSASILNLCVIAIDRYYAIHNPLFYAKKRTFKRALVCIGIVWLVSGLISIPPLVGWNKSFGPGLYDADIGICKLTDERSYVIYSALGAFYIPLFTMSFVYIKIFQATRRRFRQRANAAAAAKLAVVTCCHTISQDQRATSLPADISSTEYADRASRCPDNVELATVDGHLKGLPDKSGSGCKQTNTLHTDARCPPIENKEKNRLVYQFYEEKRRISLSQERRASRMMAIVMGVFVFCWLPFFLMYVIFAFCDPCAQTHRRVANIILWLGYMNSALNPVIYTVFNLDFRRAFKRLLQGHCKRMP